MTKLGAVCYIRLSHCRYFGTSCSVFFSVLHSFCSPMHFNVFAPGSSAQLGTEHWESMYTTVITSVQVIFFSFYIYLHY